jgi:hypothetical protein
MSFRIEHSYVISLSTPLRSVVIIVAVTEVNIPIFFYDKAIKTLIIVDLQVLQHKSMENQS